MNILILGCGFIGPAAALYLSRQPVVKKLTLLDISSPQLLKTQKLLYPLSDKKKLHFLPLDIGNQDALTALMKKHDIIAATLPWPATRLAITAAMKASRPLISITRPHYPDLKFLNATLKEKTAPVLLGCGLEPGLTEIMARQAIEGFSHIETLKLRCGGIPQNPCPPLNYKSIFNSTGLPIDPRSAYTIENGKRISVPRFSGIEPIYIDHVGQLEAWHDGMLPWLIDLPLLKRARLVSQKTLRWPGFAASIQHLADLGFLDKTPVSINRQQIIPKQLTNAILRRHTQFTRSDRDVSILQVEAQGIRHGKKECYQSTLLDFYDESDHITAMARTTGFTLGIITLFIGSHKIKKQGLIRPEEIFIHKNYLTLLSALEEVGITFQSNSPYAPSRDKEIVP